MVRVKMFLCLITHYEVEVWFYALFTSAVDGDERLESRYGRVTPCSTFLCIY